MSEEKKPEPEERENETEDEASERAESAEQATLGGKSVLHSTYRGRTG